MGLIKTIKDFRNFQKRSANISTMSSDELANALESFNFLNSTKSDLKLSAAFACVRLLSEVTASLPRMVYRDISSGGKEAVKTHPAFKVLHNPNPFMSGYIYEQLMAAMCQTDGNAVAIIVTKNGHPVKLLPVPWADVDQRISNGQIYYGIKNNLWGINKVYAASEVIHRKTFPELGITGRAPLKYARLSIQNGHKSQEFENEFWKKGGIAKNVIEDPAKFPSPEAFLEWKKTFGDVNGGNHGTIFLDGGRKLNQLSLPVPDQNFINLKTFTVQDVCRFFGVPSHMVNDLQKSSYNTLEQQNRAWVQNRLRPDVKGAEEEYELKLFTEEERATHHIKFVLDGLLRGNMADTRALVQVLVQTGTFTRNEVRDIYFNANPIDGFGMDEPLNPEFLAGKQSENNENNNSDGNE